MSLHGGTISLIVGKQMLTFLSYIASAIRSPEYEAELIGKGVEFAPQESVARCMMKLATDRAINGTSMFLSQLSILDS